MDYVNIGLFGSCRSGNWREQFRDYSSQLEQVNLFSPEFKDHPKLNRNETFERIVDQLLGSDILIFCINGSGLGFAH